MSKRHAATLLGVPIDEYNTFEFIERLEQLIKQPEQAIICPVNADMLNQCYTNDWLRSFISGADIIQAESSGILFGAKLTGQVLSSKITSNEFIYSLAEAWENKNYSIYFLGGPVGQAESAAEKLHKKYPNFKIVGCHRGHLTDMETVEVIQSINALKPSVLMVGFGCPIQEEWIAKYKSSLNVSVLWPIGNLTSYISGKVKTAPQWMKDFGLEWLYRLCQEPYRMWKRYIVGNPLFIIRILWHDVLVVNKKNLRK